MAPSLEFDGRGRWIEPFVGGAAVALAQSPTRALLSDANPHLIAFYRAVGAGRLDETSVRAHLTTAAEGLQRDGADHYYRLRKRFNTAPTPLDFLALNHTCFNGLIRFNRAGEFNTPFCRNPRRLSPALIDSVSARVGELARFLAERDWEFRHADWRDTVARAQPEDFVYLDPPYFGRNAGYHNAWPEAEARALATGVRTLRCKWALSDWLEGADGRANELLLELYGDYEIKRLAHRYSVGAPANSRGGVVEALVLSS